MLEYHYWGKDLEEVASSKDRLLYYDFTQELHQIYTRKIVIIEDILSNLSPQLEDEQYSGTIADSYEKELTQLNEKQAQWEPIVREKIEKLEHKNMLECIGMTQDQWDKHLEKDTKQLRKKILAKNNIYF